MRWHTLLHTLHKVCTVDVVACTHVGQARCLDDAPRASQQTTTLKPSPGSPPGVDPTTLANATHALFTQVGADPPTLAAAAARGLGVLCVYGPLPPPSLDADALCKALRARVDDEATTIPALQGLGLMALGRAPTVSRAVVDTVLATAHGKRADDVVFAAGETLAMAFGGVAVSPHDVLCTPLRWLAAHHARGIVRDGADVEMCCEDGAGVEGALQERVVDALLALAGDRAKEVGHRAVGFCSTQFHRLA